MLAAKKNIGSYTFSTDPNNFSATSNNYLGIAIGNFTGSTYNVYEKKADIVQELIVTIYYGGELTTESIVRNI